MEPTQPIPTRRAVLVAGIAVAGAAGGGVLAGCSSSAKSVAHAGKSVVHAGLSSAGPRVLAKVTDIPVGDAVSATLDGKPILISQPAAGTIVAFSAVCTHQGCTVSPAGKTFHCPCHGSVFNAANGQVISGPAPAPLNPVAVKVTGGDVVSG